MPAHKIAVMGGDGIGPEVVEAGVRVLDVISEVEPDFKF
jgi:tartrate dehydrogenase/decarboxylase/D-malate dehydrogenase